MAVNDWKIWWRIEKALILSLTTNTVESNFHETCGCTKQNRHILEKFAENARIRGCGQ